MLRAGLTNLWKHGQRVLQGVSKLEEVQQKCQVWRNDATRQGIQRDSYAVYRQNISTVKTGYFNNWQHLQDKFFASRVFTRLYPVWLNSTSRGLWSTKARVSHFAFVASLVIGSNAYNKAGDECRQSSNICSQIQNSFGSENVCDNIPEFIVDRSASDFYFRERVGNGCNGVVYSVELKHGKDNDHVTVTTENEDLTSTSTATTPSYHSDISDSSTSSTNPSDQYITSLFDNISSTSSTFVSALRDQVPFNADSTTRDSIIEDIASENKKWIPASLHGDFLKRDLVIKILFNYLAEESSDIESIARTMSKELVPATALHIDQLVKRDCMPCSTTKLQSLPLHPNIINIRGSFVGDWPQLPDLPDCLREFPAALPTTLNPEGYGCSKTMFLIMDRYTCNLEQYLKAFTPTAYDKTLILLQLLEAVVHLNRHGIAHRDLKLDNVLCQLDSKMHGGVRAVLTDFGHCLAGQGLIVPYNSSELDRGGNRQYMAPEIALAKPGKFSHLDYTKSDLWALGLLACEMFVSEDSHESKKVWRLALGELKIYCERDLPRFEDDNLLPTLPGMIRRMLIADVNKRPSAETVVNALQLALWAPRRILIGEGGTLPTDRDILRWLVAFAVRVLATGTSPTSIEDEMKSLFLGRVTVEGVRRALLFLSTC